MLFDAGVVLRLVRQGASSYGRGKARDKRIFGKHRSCVWESLLCFCLQTGARKFHRGFDRPCVECILVSTDELTCDGLSPVALCCVVLHKPM
jgi:hypothetical protein